VREKPETEEETMKEEMGRKFVIRKKRRKIDDGEDGLHSASGTYKERDDIKVQPKAVITTTPPRVIRLPPHRLRRHSRLGQDRQKLWQQLYIVCLYMTMG
jgi:hypothetical protein